ncbi:MAG: glycoside hydrolase family 88 protein [Clostridia bacterium]|nr:glycoside hydrolase family 88 protein [Clostridia bacterium]
MEIEKPDCSVFDVTSDKKEIMKIVADNMLKTRPHGKIKYMPFVWNNAFSYTELSYTTVNLKSFFENAETGDVAYAVFGLLVPYEDDILLTVTGKLKVFYNSKIVGCCKNGEEKEIKLHVHEGVNEVVIKCEALENEFGFKFVPSTTHYPKMWAKDYLYYIREVFTVGEIEGEQGIAVSRLYKGATLDGVTDFENGSREYIFPQLSQDKEIELSKIFDDCNCYVLALTYIKKSGELEVKADSDLTLYINEQKQEGTKINVKENDRIEAVLKPDAKVELLGNAKYEIPFLTSNRTKHNKVLLLQMENDKLPEIQFKNPYNIGGKQVFWRFTDGQSYLRPYLDTYFYGQWFYAIMVGNYGLLKASSVIGGEYLDYFNDAMNAMVDFYWLMKYETDLYGAPSFLGRGMKLPDLDSIGTIGMNLAELYKIEGRQEVRTLLDVLAEAIDTNIPRFDDGAFYRGETMWADDTFMSCPFLVRMGNITGEQKYYDDCLTQIRGFKKRLYMQDKHIFSHIYFTKDRQANGIPWGRGNGWILFTLSELLQCLPEDYYGRKEIQELFVEFAEGIKELQDECGMWHQVLTNPQTYIETSCTAMFILAMSRGLRTGILGEEYRTVVEKAWDGLCREAISAQGDIYGVCKGSGCSYDEKYYAELYAVKNDDHGTGVVLAALNSLILMEN